MGRHTKALQPVHSSLLKRHQRNPWGLARIKLPTEMRVDMTRVALDIFTDASNANVSFQHAILAVYLSGLHHGSAVTQEGISA